MRLLRISNTSSTRLLLYSAASNVPMILWYLASRSTPASAAFFSSATRKSDCSATSLSSVLMASRTVSSLWKSSDTFAVGRPSSEARRSAWTAISLFCASDSAVDFSFTAP